MSWKERTVMTIREEFVVRGERKEISMSALCREYGITRKTGYKWIERARNGEPLTDRSRTPHTITGKTLPEIEDLIITARDEHPAWGPRKLGRYLSDKGYKDLPCKSTIGNILSRNNRIEPESSESHRPTKRFERKQPNDLWQMDFKGDFLMGDNTRCYPLTILDDHSRFSLCLNARPNVTYKDFLPTFISVFKEYGLPRDILCDNGKPWGDSKGGITSFDVLMMQLGILPIHIRPLHPQTQGKDERFHRTLNIELLKRTRIENLKDAQKVFDPWRQEYNCERPHEALSLDVPAKHYRESKIKYTDKISDPDYDTGTRLRKVNCKGYISLCQHRYFLSDSLIGKYLSLHDEEDDIVSLCYGKFQVARIDLKEQFLISKHIYRHS